MIIMSVITDHFFFAGVQDSRSHGFKYFLNLQAKFDLEFGPKAFWKRSLLAASEEDSNENLLWKNLI